MGESQRTFHILTEALALPAGIYLITMGIATDLPTIHRVAFIALGCAHLLIDGYLLLFTWKRPANAPASLDATIALPEQPLRRRDQRRLVRTDARKRQQAQKKPRPVMEYD
jgi:hypothetical protein